MHCDLGTTSSGYFWNRRVGKKKKKNPRRCCSSVFLCEKPSWTQTSASCVTQGASWAWGIPRRSTRASRRSDKGEFSSAVVTVTETLSPGPRDGDGVTALALGLRPWEGLGLKDISREEMRTVSSRGLCRAERRPLSRLQTVTGVALLSAPTRSIFTYLTGKLLKKADISLPSHW